MRPFHARSALALLALAALVKPAVARATDSPPDPDWIRRPAPNPLRAPHGLQLGLRVGVAHPGGMLGGGPIATTPRVSDLAETWVPIGIDAGYRISPVAYLGASLLWGGTFGNDNGLCAACGFRYDFQALADLRVYPLPNATLNPWFAIGVGWEVMHVNFEGVGSSGTESANYQGPVLGNVQIGLDLRKAAMAVGPYLGLEFAEFAFHSLNPSPAGESSSVGAHAVHEWFTVGLRASFGP